MLKIYFYLIFKQSFKAKFLRTIFQFIFQNKKKEDMPKKSISYGFKI